MSLTQGEIKKIAKRYASDIRKAAASCRASKHTKARQKKRPIRVETLLKKGSQSGADLRLPLMGGTKFPTQDSLAYSKKLLKKHQDNASFDGSSPSIKDTVPNYSSKTDIMPKTGADMSKDPLIRYLQKQAAESTGSVGKWSKGNRKIDKAELITSSEFTAPKGDAEEAKTDEDPTPGNKSFPDEKGVSDWHRYMARMFSHKPTRKFEEKDYTPKSGTVGKVARS